MLKNSWTYVAVAVAVTGAGAAAYYFTDQTESVEAPARASEPTQAITATTQAPSNDDEVKRKTLEGIGSIKKLKPVPLQPPEQR